MWRLISQRAVEYLLLGTVVVLVCIAIAGIAGDEVAWRLSVVGLLIANCLLTYRLHCS